MMITRTNWNFWPWLLIAMLVAAWPASATMAQAQADPKAAKAFEQLVKSLRERDSLSVGTKLKIEVAQDGMQSQAREVEATFTYRRDGAGVVELNEFICYIKDQTIWATHESTEEHSYFSQPFDGSAYWMLLNLFRDIPFPHLGIFWGDQPMEDLYMELHPAATEIVPSAVSEEEVDGKKLRTITLSDESATLTLRADPAKQLVESATLVLTQGNMVQPGATITYTYTFDNEPFDEPLDDSVFTLDRAQRQRADVLTALVDVPPPVAAPGGGGDGPGGAPAAPLVGQPAPEFTLATMTGDAIDLVDLRGQVVVLDFWATWCGPCVVGLPKLHEAARWAANESLPVKVITINTFQRGTPDERLAAARNFWKQHKHTLPVAMDYTDQTAAAYQVRGIPTTVIIRADGVVHAVHVGIPPGGPDALTTQLKEEIRGAIEALQVSE